MRVTRSRVYSRPAPVPKMPPGLVELMEGLTKDVLKNNPQEVYEFCADHMRKLLEIRDGPSNKKTLPLDQKILKAQEKIRQRSEQRWQRFNKELQVKVISESIETEGNLPHEQPIVAGESIPPSLLKPHLLIHHDQDLTQTSEIEILCEADNATTHEDLKTESLSKNIETESIKDEVEPLLEKQMSYEVTNHSQDQEEKIQVEINAMNPDITISETIKEHQSSDKYENKKEQPEMVDVENDKGITHNNELISNSVVVNEENVEIKATLEDKKENVENGSPALPEIRDEKNDKQPTKLNTDEDNIEVSFLKDETDENVRNTENKSSELIDTEIHIDHLENADNNENIESTAEQKIGLLDGEHNELIVVGDTSKIEPIVNLELSDNLENIDDIETVLNEAIENTIRKDSSTNESLKDMNVLNEEESDASDSSNENKANDQPQPENVISENNEVKKDTYTIESMQTDVTTKNSQSLVDQNLKPNEQDKIDNRDSKTVQEDDAVSAEKKDHISTDPADKEINSSESGDIARNDNNTNAMDLETAAVTIQKVFRTFLFKSRNSTFDDTVNDENNLSDDEDKKDDRQFLPNNINKERRTLGISRMDTVLQTVNEEKSLSLSTDDSSLSSAATIIQAHVRGFLVRNKLHSGGKTVSSNSLAISNEPSATSLDGDTDLNKNKTILNIHIVPEGGNYLSRDESMITSMDLSLDGSPPSSVNLHPLGYNTSERRKQLKREDAVQSVSPPSNNSGKLSEDVDSVKELTINENETNILNQEEKATMASLVKDDSHQETEVGSLETTPTNSLTIETVIGDNKTSNTELFSSPEPVTESSDKNKRSLTKQSSDEMDVVTPFKENNEAQKLLHSGEFHDAALPTKVSRSDTPVVSGE